jgi:Ca2+-binding EF-hand superfamily protein
MADWRNQIHMIINKVKNQLCAKGIDNVLQLQPWLQQADKNNNGVLDRLEFEACLQKIGIFLTTQELTCVYNHFDKNKDGVVSYAEFVSALKVSDNLINLGRMVARDRT